MRLGRAAVTTGAKSGACALLGRGRKQLTTNLGGTR